MTPVLAMCQPTGPRMDRGKFVTPVVRTHLPDAISAFPPRSAAGFLFDEPRPGSATAHASATIAVANRFRITFAFMRPLCPGRSLTGT